MSTGQPQFLFHRPQEAAAIADGLVGAGPFSYASGLFLAAPRRTGKSTFMREDLVPALVARGVTTTYVDLWSDRQRDPGLLITDAVASTLRGLDSSGVKTLRKSGLSKIIIGGALTFDVDKLGQADGVTLFVENFFAERYDYRRQWAACLATLAGDDREAPAPLATRAIRTVLAVVDSPAGVLYLRDGATGALSWAGSWNLPATAALPDDHPVVAGARDEGWVQRLDFADRPERRAAPLDLLGPLWLAIPLTQRGVTTGMVIAAPPRAPFLLEQEVSDLLRIVCQEVATYIAEQRATQTLLQTRQLHDYSKRFAFVAHDIKNISSQLTLLLSNAETHISNPAFQKDMLETVHASVRKISSLLQRLEHPATDRTPGAMSVIARLEPLLLTYQRIRRAKVALEHDGSTASVAMDADLFEAVVTHLLNNAVEAAPSRPVVVQVRHEPAQVVVDIVDRGPGMSAEFVRDNLFRPFTTSKSGGSGIGAYQARELLRAAGGDLAALPTQGGGTTMRLVLPRVDPLGVAGPVTPSIGRQAA